MLLLNTSVVVVDDLTQTQNLLLTTSVVEMQTSNIRQKHKLKAKPKVKDKVKHKHKQKLKLVLLLNSSVAVVQ